MSLVHSISGLLACPALGFEYHDDDHQDDEDDDQHDNNLQTGGRKQTTRAQPAARRTLAGP